MGVMCVCVCCALCGCGLQISIVRKLLDSGANVVVADQKGNTALVRGCCSPRCGACGYGVVGCDLTAMLHVPVLQHVAAASGFVGVVKELLARGAKVTRNKYVHVFCNARRCHMFATRPRCSRKQCLTCLDGW